jgi:hypothetical protein
MLFFLQLFDGKEEITPRAGAEFDNPTEARSTAIEAARNLIASEAPRQNDRRWFEITDAEGRIVKCISFQMLQCHRVDLQHDTARRRQRNR